MASNGNALCVLYPTIRTLSLEISNVSENTSENAQSNSGVMLSCSARLRLCSPRHLFDN